MSDLIKEALNRNNGCLEWEVISLSQVKTIKGLIKYRSLFDGMYQVKKLEALNPLESSGTPRFHEIITVTYMDLESLIKRINFSEKQLKIINMLEDGNTEKDIAYVLRCDQSQVFKILNTICQKIKQRNDFEWKEWLETSNKNKSKDNHKQCSKCKEWKKASNEFFKADKRGKNGLKSICRKCDK